MIVPGAGTKVMVATRSVNFRKGFDALAALVGVECRGNPYSGVIYVFQAKRSDPIKLVWWDGTGVALNAVQGVARRDGVETAISPCIDNLDFSMSAHGFATLEIIVQKARTAGLYNRN